MAAYVPPSSARAPLTQGSSSPSHGAQACAALIGDRTHPAGVRKGHTVSRVARAPQAASQASSGDVASTRRAPSSLR